MNEFMDNLGDILENMSDSSVDSNRPFTGQSHTDQGERGKTEICNIRFRDLSDCIAKAWIDAAGHTVESEELEEELRRRADDNTLNYNDLYNLQCGDIDPIALIQATACRVEQLMGIFPNVSKLKENNE